MAKEAGGKGRFLSRLLGGTAKPAAKAITPRRPQMTGMPRQPTPSWAKKLQASPGRTRRPAGGGIMGLLRRNPGKVVGTGAGLSGASLGYKALTGGKRPDPAGAGLLPEGADMGRSKLLGALGHK